jgi:ubiquinone/menaquinone biosynthesis C-methylase UbiE
MSPIAAHAAVASRYDWTPNPLLSLERRMAAPLLPSDLRGATAVDVACGTGRWARWLRRRGATVIALDRCIEMLRYSPRPAVMADASRLPLPDAFADLTISAFALSYTGSCLDELARITRRGGMVIVSDMHPVATRRGWSRISPETIPYAIEYLGASGLRRTAIVESAFDDIDLAIFAPAGKPELVDLVRGVPAVFVAAWVRE